MDSFSAVATPSLPLVAWSLGLCLLSILLIQRLIPLKVTIPLVVIKFLIPFSYFGIWADGSWFIGGDDSGYMEAGLMLIETGLHPLSIPFDPQARALFSSPSVAIYQWWNMLWMYLIERAYYAPVLANVFVSVLSGLIFFGILQEIGFPKIYRQGFLVFFLLHWDTIVWTSLLNLKEPLVIFAMLVFIRSALNLENRQKIWLGLAGILGCTVFFQGIRFYFPALMGAAYLTYLVLHYRNTKVLLVTLSLAIAVAFLYLEKFVPLLRELMAPQVFGHGIARVLFSPIPWRVTDPATYLIPGSILHWVLLPGAFFAGWQFIRRPDGARFLILFLLVGLAFYALVPRLGSPRHRAPLMALWTLLEYHFLYLIFITWLRCTCVNACKEFGSLVSRVQIR